METWTIIQFILGFAIGFAVWWYMSRKPKAVDKKK